MLELVSEFESWLHHTLTGGIGPVISPPKRRFPLTRHRRVETTSPTMRFARED